MKFVISIDCDNAAFDPCNGAEVAKILEDLADGLGTNDLSPGDDSVIWDSNGNNVGYWRVE